MNFIKHFSGQQNVCHCCQQHQMPKDIFELSELGIILSRNIERRTKTPCSKFKPGTKLWCH